MTLIPVLRAGRHLIDQHSVSRPWEPRAYRSHDLESAVVENWSDEIDAFRTFAATRFGRHLTRFAIGSAGVGLYQATQIKWIRYSIKGVAKFAPVIGWGLLAYDLYNLGEDLELY